MVRTATVLYAGAGTVVADENQRVGSPAWFLSKDDLSVFTNAGDVISPDAGLTGGGLMNGQSFAIPLHQANHPETGTNRAGS